MWCKSLVSPLHIQRPAIIYSYSEKYDATEYRGKGGKYFNLGKKLEEVIGQILKQNQAEGKGGGKKVKKSKSFDLPLGVKLIYCFIADYFQLWAFLNSTNSVW